MGVFRHFHRTYSSFFGGGKRFFGTLGRKVGRGLRGGGTLYRGTRTLGSDAS